jgi:HD-like signal output (HDOD) protein
MAMTPTQTATEPAAEARRSPVIATEHLVQDLDSLPAQQAVAVRVLQVSGDPRSSAVDLAGALMGDPAITAQVIRLANSAYYGLSGRVGTVPFAVTVVGFVSIRSIVAAFAAGALGSDTPVPEGFWERAAASAAASSLVASRVGASRADAFSLGLLHELGDFLLYRASPEAHAEVDEGAAHWDCRRRCRLERALFGVDHGQALARCLESWLFPTTFVEAIEAHADTSRVGNPLARALVSGQAIAALSLRADHDRHSSADLLGRLTSRLEIGDVELGQAWPLSRQARADAEALSATLT